MQRQYFGAFNLLLLFFFLYPLAAHTEETIRLQLKWQHQFQFAGYYAAKHLGYYRDAGLNVDIIEAIPGASSTDVVLQGDADYGVGNSGIVLARGAGEPLVVLAVIFQHSPFTLITQHNSSINDIHDLAHKHLMIEPLADDIVAYLNHEGVPLDTFERVSRVHSLDDFIAGQVDAISAYVTSEPYVLKQQGIQFNTFSPRSAGIDFYGDNLFTTEEEIRLHPDRVRKFLKASLRGWRYAMDHQDEIIDLILREYPTELDPEFLVFEAQALRDLMHPELIDIGYMLAGRWRHIADTYTDLGMLPENFSLDGFLYEENPQPNYFWFYVGSSISLFILSIVTLVTLRFSKLNQQLSSLLHIKSQFANIGESVNNISHQWKQPLNELAIQLMLLERLSSDISLPDKARETISKATMKSHTLLEFMAKTVDAFSHLLRTRKNISNFSPNDTIAEVIYLINDSFHHKNITIDYKASTDVTSISGNSTEFAHVILSILNNARDIIGERKIIPACISITSFQQSDRYFLKITDNAGGINPKSIDKIFDLGFSDKVLNSSGVGLYIVKKIIVDRFHGSIDVANREEGAVFTISIPSSA